MKRTISILLMCILMFSFAVTLSACANNNNNDYSKAGVNSTESYSTKPNTTGVLPIDYTAQRVESMDFIDSYISKNIYSEYVSSLLAINAVRNTYVELINSAESSFAELQKKCILLIDLLLAEDLYNFKTAKIWTEYSSDIETADEIIIAIQNLGYYAGTQVSYETELSNISSTQQQAYIAYEKDKRNMPFNGMSLTQIENKYNNAKNSLQKRKNELEILWQRKIDLSSALEIKNNFIIERDSLLFTEANNYNNCKNQLNTQLLAIGDIQ